MSLTVDLCQHFQWWKPEWVVESRKESSSAICVLKWKDRLGDLGPWFWWSLVVWVHEQIWQFGYQSESWVAKRHGQCQRLNKSSAALLFPLLLRTPDYQKPRLVENPWTEKASATPAFSRSWLREQHLTPWKACRLCAKLKHPRGCSTSLNLQRQMLCVNIRRSYRCLSPSDAGWMSHVCISATCKYFASWQLLDSNSTVWSLSHWQFPKTAIKSNLHPHSCVFTEFLPQNNQQKFEVSKIVIEPRWAGEACGAVMTTDHRMGWSRREQFEKYFLGHNAQIFIRCTEQVPMNATRSCQIALVDAHVHVTRIPYSLQSNQSRVLSILFPPFLWCTTSKHHNFQTQTAQR